MYQSVRAEIAKVIFGQDEVIDFSLAALFSSGHILLEGPPGVAKTLLVRTIAATLNLDYRRIQMTPDLLPNDITGSSVFRQNSQDFEFRRGPIFTHFMLADEVNRASARTQSALLEAMQELSVTHDGVSHLLPEPFITFATQNPIEQEGTYPCLPLRKLNWIGSCSKLSSATHPIPKNCGFCENTMRQVASLILERWVSKRSFRQAISWKPAGRSAKLTCETKWWRSMLQRLLVATRNDDSLSVGASPRSGLMLLMGAKSLARFAGREFVTPDDIHTAFIPALRHRVVLSCLGFSNLSGTTTDEVLGQLLEAVEVPR